MGKIRVMKITRLMNKIKALNKYRDILYSQIGKKHSKDVNSSQTHL